MLMIPKTVPNLFSVQAKLFQFSVAIATKKVERTQDPSLLLKI